MGACIPWAPGNGRKRPGNRNQPVQACAGDKWGIPPGAGCSAKGIGLNRKGEETMNLKIASVFLAALPVFAYQAAQPQANQPKISDAQRQALMKLQTDSQAQKWSDVLADANSIMESFPDSPYKQNVLYMAFQAAGNANSYDQLVV